MSTYDCILQFGHMGAGQGFERHVRVRAFNIIDAMRRAKRLPGVKKGRLGACGGSVLKVALVQ